MIEMLLALARGMYLTREAALEAEPEALTCFPAALAGKRSTRRQRTDSALEPVTKGAAAISDHTVP